MAEEGQATTDTTDEESHSRIVTVMVPENCTAEEGDVLVFEVDGQHLELPLPAGARPGDALQVQLGATETAEEEERPPQQQSMMELTLREGLILVLHENDNDNDNDNDNGNDDNDNDNDNGNDDNDDDDDDTHSVTWPAGVFLARCMATWPHLSSLLRTSPHILELGSGPGTGGLAAALVGGESNTSVTLTDKTENALVGLRRNVEANRRPNIAWNVRVRVLPWGLPAPSLEDGRSYDLVLGSDLLYDPDPHLYEALAKTIVSTRAPRVWLAVRWRKPGLERRFFELMEDDHGYTFTLLLPSEEEEDETTSHVTSQFHLLPCPLSWREYGNPDCEASNRYFASSLVRVGGSHGSTNDDDVGDLVSINQLTEEHLGKLTDEQYELYEAMQTQIYEGKPTIKL